ncbi:MAG: DNA/RNA non-specific endonuclease [Geobacteraceae bacterium]|nr:DNA/RNA non-specific endonuclease [Geobacteraceae bacterium]
MHRLITLLCLLALALPAYAQTSCQEPFADGKVPVITNPKMSSKYRELCNQAYAVGHSGITRTPLWSAEHLTRERLFEGKGLKRSNNFRSDTRLPSSERAELSDYARSGYDRGHMAPSADFGDPESQDESFLLSNMIPQEPENNRGIHEGIESAVRKEVKKRGELYVITGPLFQGGQLQALKNRVIIPSGVYKCLYDPTRKEAGCYLEQNAPGADYSTVSVAEIEKLAGINLFPALTQDVKNRVIRLPIAKARSRKGNR